MALHLYFTEGLNQSLISSVAQAWLFLATQELDISSFCKNVMLWYFHFIVVDVVVVVVIVVVRKPVVGFM